MRCESLLVAAGLLVAQLCLKAQGTITTMAGTGAAGFSGDGGPAVQAALNQAVYLAFDGLGNLYIADQFNHRIRKVVANGVITTVAGTGVAGFSGDGVHGHAGFAESAYRCGRGHRGQRLHRRYT